MVDMSSISPLRELFDSVAQANDWSQRDVARRIEDRGHKLKRSRINQIINARPLDSITAEGIEAIADGLGISHDRVAVAAVQAMGYRISVADITPAEAIMRDTALSEATRRALLSVLRADEEVRGA